MSSLTVDSRTERPPWILPVIIISQFAGTSLWFAGNAVLSDFQHDWGISSDALASITSAVQLGFILGTFIFGFFTFADRFSPRIIFLFSSVAGGICNFSVYLFAHDLTGLLILRFMTGVCLAGIYPVGMKIASGWYREGLGNALGFLVGALVLGTSFPHLLKAFGATIHWETVMFAISVISASGGILMWRFVPDGPHLTKGTHFNPNALKIIFTSKEIRPAALSYFGHMWELYTFYAFAPLLLSTYAAVHQLELNISFWSFVIIGAGSAGCAIGGMVSDRIGSGRIAWIYLCASGICCLISPLMFQMPEEVFILFLTFWGLTVVGDSPQFSTLIARAAPKELLGSLLTISVCIGFALTIASIELTSYLLRSIRTENIFLTIAAGPVLGLFFLFPLIRNKHKRT